MQNILSANNTTHALLSASAAHHWRSCPASAVLNDYIPDDETRDTTAAREGTAMHEVVEHLLLTGDPLSSIKYLPLKDVDDTPIENVPFTAGHKQIVKICIDYIKSFTFKFNTEARVFYGHALGVPDALAYGTADFNGLEFRPDGNVTLHVADLKTGVNYVEAYENLQLSLYASGLLRTYSLVGEIDKVALHIIQPSISYEPSIWETTPQEIDELVSELKAPADRIIKLASGKVQLDESDFGEHEDDCRFCKVNGMHNLRQLQSAMEAFQAIQEMDGKEDEGDSTKSILESLAHIDNDKLAYWLKQVPRLEKFLSAIQKQALTLLESGEHIPGYKLVRGKKGNRKWIEDINIGNKVKNLLPKEIAAFKEPTLKSISELEKDLKNYMLELIEGRKVDPEQAKEEVAEIQNLLCGLTERSEGKITFAPVGDPRTEIVVADENDFEVLD